MKISEILKAGKAVIADPKNFTQDGSYAKVSKESDVSVYGNDPEATCFCSIGALQRVNGEGDHNVRGVGYLDIALSQLTLPGPRYMHITSANDNFPHETVMKIWDRAIELAEKDEADD